LTFTSDFPNRSNRSRHTLTFAESEPRTIVHLQPENKKQILPSAYQHCQEWFWWALTEQDVETIVQRAREKFPDATPRIISDNGPQFVAKEFKQYVRLCGMTHVRTSPYYPQSNGKIERFHRTIKGECIRPGSPLTLEDARRIVGKYVVHYNAVRLHGALGYITPEDKLLGREQAIFDERDRKLEEARDRRQRQRAEATCAEQKQTCYNDASRPEDKALLASTLSAVSGSETRADGHAPSVSSSSSLLSTQSDKRITETTPLVH
jgi:hypothetical protein